MCWIVPLGPDELITARTSFANPCKWRFHRLCPNTKVCLEHCVSHANINVEGERYGNSRLQSVCFLAKCTSFSWSSAVSKSERSFRGFQSLFFHGEKGSFDSLISTFLFRLTSPPLVILYIYSKHPWASVQQGMYGQRLLLG